MPTPYNKIRYIAHKFNFNPLEDILIANCPDDLAGSSSNSSLMSFKSNSSNDSSNKNMVMELDKGTNVIKQWNKLPDDMETD